MYGITIYLLTNEKTDETYWLYGTALQIDGSTEMPFKIRNISSKKPYKLQMLVSIMNYEALIHFVTELENKKNWVFNLEKTKDDLSINLPSWKIRPRIIATERNNDHRSAYALTNHTVNATIYYALEKEKWLAEAFDTMEDFLEKGTHLESILSAESTLKLFSTDSERFGNFEIFTSPLQHSLFLPIGLHIDTKRTMSRVHKGHRQGETHVKGVTVWADYSLEEHLPLQLNVILWNGRDKSEAVVQDQLFNITKIGELIHCDAKEPISAIEVKLWNANGKILHYKKTYLIRQIKISMGIDTGTTVIRDPWSEKLPKALKDQVEINKRILPQEIKVGDFLLDPWVEETEKFSKFLKQVKTESANKTNKKIQVESYFYSSNQEAEVRFFEFVKSKLNAANTEEALIVDPFFDAKAAAKILSRTETRAPLTILTSLTNKETETGISLLESMNTFLQKYKKILPTDLTVINVQNSEVTKQQFHDRYFLIKQNRNWRGWLLGNSYNSQAQRYPSVIVELPSNIMDDVHNYIKELKTGQVSGRPEALSHTLFCQKPFSREESNLVADLPIFQHWELIMEPFHSQPNEDPVDTAKRLIASGYFEQSGKHYSWTVKEEKLDEVRVRLSSYLKAIDDVKRAQNFLLALSLWNYHGLDLKPAQLIPRTPFWVQAMSKAAEEIQETIANNIQNEDNHWHLIKEKVENLSELFQSYIDWWSIYQYSFTYTRLVYKYEFILDGLEIYDPKTYYGMLDKKWILTPHFLKILHQVKVAQTEVSLSSLATRLLYFSYFDSHGRPKGDNFLLPIEEKISIEQKTLFIAFDNTFKEQQQSEFLKKHASLFQKPIDENLLTFITQLRQTSILTFLNQSAHVQKDELIIKLKKAIVSQWINKLLQNESLHFHYETDQPLTEEMAILSIEAFKENWENWYVKNVLDKLDLQKLRNPFLYYHDYSKWRNLFDKALWSFHFGFMSLQADTVKLHGEVTLRISKLFLEYLSDTLSIYRYDSGLLEEVIYAVGFYLPEYEGEQMIEQLLETVEGKNFNPNYALLLYGSHPTIFIKRRSELKKLLHSNVLKLQLGEKVIGRLIWLSRILNIMSKNIDDKEVIQDIKSLSKTVETLLKDTSKNITDLSLQFQLTEPVTDTDYEKWAQLFRTSITEFKEGFKRVSTFEVYYQIVGVGLYLFGNTSAFQDWIHQKDELTNRSPWDLIYNGKSEKALDELIRMIVGNFS